MLKYRYMKHWVYAVLVLLLFSPFSFSQIYRAQDFTPAADDVREGISHWEISVGAAAFSGQMHDFTGQRLVQGELGAEVRAFYSLADWAAVGVSGGVSGPLKKTELVDKYRTYRLEALVKFTLTPRASPRSYITAGMGWQQHDISYFHLWEKKFSVPFVSLGMGVETSFAENWFAGLELRGMYHLQSARNVYFYFPHRWEAAVHLRTGWRF